MSDKINDGGRAFPQYDFFRQSTQNGMTLRQWYAGNALIGFLNTTDFGYLIASLNNGLCPKDKNLQNKILVERIFELSDAMIKHEQEGK